MLERSILSLLVATVEQNIRYLDTVSSIMDRRGGPYLQELKDQDPYTMETLRNLSKSLGELARAVIWLAGRIRSRLETDHVGPSAITDFIGLEHFEEDVASNKRELMYLNQELVAKERTRLDRYSNDQSNSVKRLTILATYFLPLSISATILSMQTRFSDLGFLLYDFVGVTLLLGFVALTIYTLSKKIMAFQKSMQDGDNLISIRGKSVRLTRMKFAYPTSLLLTVSFLIGIFKDENVGLKVLGFEAAGAFGVLILVALLMD
ncbi:hypothetical protein E8E13_004898 [Curvularia kusanoi]|uniref:Uncharacterized protein n=1 Tax=Curvularia kusanoi TaxID=90978 RepID=A0A9P4T882_CURKU|nr:hypothetical protein E8E13_004898 [Curvularia kusanoi]